MHPTVSRPLAPASAPTALARLARLAAASCMHVMRAWPSRLPSRISASTRETAPYTPIRDIVCIGPYGASAAPVNNAQQGQLTAPTGSFAHDATILAAHHPPLLLLLLPLACREEDGRSQARNGWPARTSVRRGGVRHLESQAATSLCVGSQRGSTQATLNADATSLPDRRTTSLHTFL